MPHVACRRTRQHRDLREGLSLQQAGSQKGHEKKASPCAIQYRPQTKVRSQAPRWSTPPKAELSREPTSAQVVGRRLSLDLATLG